MKHYWNTDIDTLFQLSGSSKDGLTSLQADKIRKEKGKNVLSESKKEHILKVFFSQFCDLLIIILIIASAISFFSGNSESTIVILVVLFLNAVLGTLQHIKAQKSLDSLKQLSSPLAKVMRNGLKIQIPSEDIVPGDVIVLDAGDLISADGRIINSSALSVNESALTGESLNVNKADCILEENTPLADRINMVYSGSLVTSGRATVLVTATGMNTELGKIAGLMNSIKSRKTPLQLSLDAFSRKLAVMIMCISAVILVLCLYRKMNLTDSLMFAVALAVAAIPEALSSIVTIVQAMGTQKMVKEHAIIKDLKAIESLGCVSVICSDKTGTLTCNKMTVQKIFVNFKCITPSQFDLTSHTDRYLLYNAVLTNDSSIADGTNIGDPTECALLEMFRKVPFKFNKNINENTIRELITRDGEIPFDSDRKLMSIKCVLSGKPVILTKGAPDIIINRLSKIEIDGTVRNITSEDIDTIKSQNKEFAKNGLRVLAFAYRESSEELTEESENDLIFSGLIAMTDPPRPEAVQAVADAKRAGIFPVMITGDHKITATAIARQIGIFEDGHLAVTGAELDLMSDEELDRKLPLISVYARVSPENKIRIVERWQLKGHVVSMTGDGVNDAPALKKADIGVAMGITGTEVSKDAAAMILSDDNFATIIKAVVNGRNVYRNIKNAILFLLSGNMAAIICVLIASLLGLPMPFAPVHLLFINLLTDSLPAIAIGMENADQSLLDQKPRDPSKNILDKKALGLVFSQGILISIFVMAGYFAGLCKNPALGSSMAFLTLTLARLFHGFNCRSRQSIFKTGLFSNKYCLLAFISGIVLLGAVIFVPALSKLFFVSYLNLKIILMIIALSAAPTFIIQSVRLFKAHRS